jgi:hypothetical protein
MSTSMDEKNRVSTKESTAEVSSKIIHLEHDEVFDKAGT